MIISIIISYIESILMTYHTYRCMAFCSENCLPDTQNTFKTHFCKKLKTYNKCNECNVYVCKECFVQLKLHNFTKCVTCRKEINESQRLKDIENQDDFLNHIRENNYLTDTNQCKSTSYSITNCCKSLSDIEDEFKICSSFLKTILIIIIPILCFILFSIIFAFNTFYNIVFNNEIVDFGMLILLIVIAWLSGTLFIVITCYCKNLCISDEGSISNH